MKHLRDAHRNNIKNKLFRAHLSLTYSLPYGFGVYVAQSSIFAYRDHVFMRCDFRTLDATIKLTILLAFTRRGILDDPVFIAMVVDRFLVCTCLHIKSAHQLPHLWHMHVIMAASVLVLARKLSTTIEHSIIYWKNCA